jgi:hypothetical protein
MSMTCPHCANFHNNTFRRDQGEIYRYRQGAFHHARIPVRSARGGSLHAGALRSRKDSKYFADRAQYYPMLFKQQQAWAGAQDAPRSTAANVETGRFFTGVASRPA